MVPQRELLIVARKRGEVLHLDDVVGPELPGLDEVLDRDPVPLRAVLSNVTLRFLSIDAAPKPSLCIDNLALATFIGRTERGFNFRFNHLFGAREQRSLLK